MSGTITPMTSWKIDVSHWPVVTEMPKSDTMVGNAALNCSCVKLPTNVMKVRMAIDTNAACVRWSFWYDSSRVSGQDRLWRLLLRLLPLLLLPLPPLLWPPSLPLLPWTSRFGRGFVSGSIFFSN